jgi:hypothetical protein
MKQILISETVKSEDFDGKRLVIFNNEREGRPWNLSARVSPDGRTFTVTRTQTGIATAFVGKENRVAVVREQIDGNSFQRFEKPLAPVLQARCDYVWFERSPQMRKRYQRDT